jgi:S1/P1 Nuclease
LTIRADVAAAATDLMKSITPAKIEEWTHSDPVVWANESFAIAERAQTKYCVQRGSSCELPNPAKVTIDAGYVAANTPVVREQLQKAGVRLAHMLDAALSKQ